MLFRVFHYVVLLMPLVFVLRSSASTIDLAQVCKILSNKISIINEKQCINIGFSTSSLTSKNGYPIIYKNVPNQPSPLKKNILIIGGIHADEISSFGVSMKWLIELLNAREYDFNWLIAPAINIEQLDQTKPTRVNAYNVDINRNFPLSNQNQKSPLSHWNLSGAKPNYYPGEYPLSESETKTIEKLVSTFKPNLIISVHAPLNLIDFDGVPKDAPQKIGSLKLDLINSYPGSLSSYYWNAKRIPTLTVELADTQKIPSNSELQGMWKDINAWLKTMYHHMVSPQKSNISLFNEAMAALALNDLQTSIDLFSLISDRKLELQTQNNLAYALYLQGKKQQSRKIWQKILRRHRDLATAVQNYYIVNNLINNQSLSTNAISLQLLHLPPSIKKRKDQNK